MAGIKSTLELAMERTGKIEISEKDKVEIRHREIAQKVNGLYHRYREGSLSLNDIQKEILRTDENTAKIAREGLLSRWIEDLSLTDDDDRLLKGIEALRGRNADEAREDVHRLRAQYRKQRDELIEKTASQLTEALRKEGIEGSAVDPHVEASPDWNEESKRLDQTFGDRLEEIRKRLSAL